MSLCWLQPGIASKARPRPTPLPRLLEPGVTAVIFGLFAQDFTAAPAPNGVPGRRDDAPFRAMVWRFSTCQLLPPKNPRVSIFFPAYNDREHRRPALTPLASTDGRSGEPRLPESATLRQGGVGLMRGLPLTSGGL